MIHGTSEDAALKICTAGFVPVGATDLGYYGQGHFSPSLSSFPLPSFPFPFSSLLKFILFENSKGCTSVIRSCMR